MYNLAIDNVCAWQNLTHLPDGTIAVVIYNQPRGSAALHFKLTLALRRRRCAV